MNYFITSGLAIIGNPGNPQTRFSDEMRTGNRAELMFSSKKDFKLTNLFFLMHTNFIKVMRHTRFFARMLKDVRLPHVKSHVARENILKNSEVN